jgi:tRNA threonylcarbamoyladenosine biosynthesis protein TsaB
MNHILNIDTALAVASVCISNNNKVLQYAENKVQKDHSTWLHPAIQQLMDAEKIEMQQLNAIAVTIGPGSYTGLRVGLSAAKGICYALNIPLITINNLALIASSINSDDADIICPCIDARRMEVYTATYNGKSLKEIILPAALVLNSSSFTSLLIDKKIMFCGNANEKLKTVIDNSNAIFSSVIATAKNMVAFSVDMYAKRQYSDLAATEPLYLKPFYNTVGQDI